MNLNLHVDNFNSITNKFPKLQLEVQLPNEILCEIFQYISCESTKLNIASTNKNFRIQILKVSPFLNILLVLFYKSHDSKIKLGVPELICNEKLVFSKKELCRIKKIEKENEDKIYLERHWPTQCFLRDNYCSIPYRYLSNNDKLHPNTATQIIKCADWVYERHGNFAPVESLIKLCKKILEGYNDQEKEEINKHDLLRTALFNTTFEKELIWKHVANQIKKQKKPVDYSSKIDVLVALSSKSIDVDRIDSKLITDKDVILASLKSYKNYMLLNDSLMDDEDFVLEALKIDESTLTFASDRIRIDKNFVLIALNFASRALRYADKSLKQDKEFILKAVKKQYRAFDDADVILKKDKKFVMEVVSIDGNAFEFADETLRADKEVLLTAIKTYGLAIKYASDELQKDKEVVLAAVANFGFLLRDLDENFKKDKDIVLAAINDYPYAINFAHQSLQNDPEIKLAAYFSNLYQQK